MCGPDERGVDPSRRRRCYACFCGCCRRAETAGVGGPARAYTAEALRHRSPLQGTVLRCGAGLDCNSTHGHRTNTRVNVREKCAVPQRGGDSCRAGSRRPQVWAAGPSRLEKWRFKVMRYPRHCRYRQRPFETAPRAVEVVSVVCVAKPRGQRARAPTGCCRRAGTALVWTRNLQLRVSDSACWGSCLVCGPFRGPRSRCPRELGRVTVRPGQQPEFWHGGRRRRWRWPELSCRDRAPLVGKIILTLCSPVFWV